VCAHVRVRDILNQSACETKKATTGYKAIIYAKKLEIISVVR